MKYTITTLRAMNKMKQSELAEKIGISAAALSAIERVDRAMLEKLAEELHCKPEEIVIGA